MGIPVSTTISTNKCLFMYDNKWDIGTLSVSTEEPNYPKEYTRHRWFKLPWRTTTVATAQWIKNYLGATPPSIQAFINRYNNFTLTGGCSVKIEADIDNTSWPEDIGGPPSINEIVGGSNEIMVKIFSAAQTALNCLYWRHWVSDNPAAGYFEVGRIFLGPYFKPIRGFATGSGSGCRGKIDPSLLAESEGGQVSSIQRDKYRPFDYTFADAPLSDKEGFIDMFDIVGTSKAFFITENMDDPLATTFYVRLVSFEIMPRFNSQLFTIHLSVIEER